MISYEGRKKYIIAYITVNTGYTVIFTTFNQFVQKMEIFGIFEGSLRKI